ncbi:MAG: hypothetical protein AAGI37_09100 [Planctomycetota bacterium]
MKSTFCLFALFLLFSFGCKSNLNTDAQKELEIDIAFYLAEQEEDKSLVRRLNPETSEPIYLHPTALIETKDIVGARKDPGEFGQPVLTVFLDENAGYRIKTATSKHINKPAVITVDDEIVVVAQIRSPLDHGFQISGDYTDEQIDEMLKKLKQ